MYFNKLILMGNVGKDPETKDVKGRMLVKFPLAVSRGKEEPAMWIDCDIWGKQAEIANEYIVKGMPVMVEGALNVRNIKGDDGYKTFISCSVYNFQMLGSKAAAGKQRQTKIEEPKIEDVPF